MPDQLLLHYRKAERYRKGGNHLHRLRELRYSSFLDRQLCKDQILLVAFGYHQQGLTCLIEFPFYPLPLKKSENHDLNFLRLTCY